MTGWRLGYACGPHPDYYTDDQTASVAIMSAPTTSQYAAIEALRNGDDDIERMKQDYDARRRLVVDGFRKMGLSCFEPEGAFYVFPNISVTGMDSETFCERLLKEEKVAVIPGTAFGDSGEGFVRVTYCYPVQHIKQALEKIRNFVARWA